MKTNMNTKKLVSILLLITFALTMFSGCGAPAAEDDSNTLTLIYNRSVPEKFIEGLQKEFPDINFELEFYQGGNYTEYARQAMLHGESSDIFTYSMALTAEEAQKYLVDLSGYTFLGNFDNAILYALDRDGCIYQLPGPVSSRCILYNKTLFDMYGWEEPTTFNELLALVKQIRTDAPDITPLAMPMPSAAYPFTMVTSLAQCGFLSSPEGTAWEERYFKGEASVSEGFAEGLTMMEKLIDADAFDAEKYEGLWHVISGDPCERKAAMSISLGGTTPILPLLEKTAEQEEYGTYCTDEFGVLPFFGLNDGQEGLSITMSTVWGINKALEEPGNEKKLENALRVMEYLSTAEAQLLLQSDNGQIPTLKNLENTNIHPEIQKLWDLNENGKKSFFLYSGYEDIMVDSGEIVKQAMLADNSQGMREQFVATCDAIRKNTLAGEISSKIYGHVEESLSIDETVQLTMMAIQQKNPVDLTLATYRGIENGIINQKGAGGRFFSGDVTEQLISIVIPNYGDTIVTVELTGAEVKDLLQNGKTLIADETESTFPYIAYGIDTEALDDSKTYTVNFHQGDYSDAFAEAHTIVDTEIEVFDAIADYLGANSPITPEQFQ